MGWLTMTRAGMGGHPTPKAYLDDQFTYCRQVGGGGTRGMRVIDSACPGNRVWYAAAEITQDDKALYVIALVCLVKWNPNDKEGYVFGYKDQEESMGPCEDGCPARILRLLSPIDRESALDWRRRCLTRLRLHARRIDNGTRVRLAGPITFGDGHVGTEFIVVKRGAKITFRNDRGFGHYAIRHFRDLPWSVVPETKVHRTIFALSTTSPAPT